MPKLTKKMKQQIVAINQAMPKKHKPKSSAQKAKRGRMRSEVILHKPKVDFKFALKHPFDPNVLGCQVPDPFPFPTSTYHSHTTQVIGCTANNSTGAGCVAFLPNPLVSMLDIYHMNHLITGDSCVLSTPMNEFNATATYASAAVYGASTITDMSQKLADFRVVSWGIKISNLQPQLSATGRVIIAFVPLGDTIPNIQQLTNSGLAGIGREIFGIDMVGLNSSAILNLPTAFELTVGDLMRGDIEIAGIYTNTNFWTFKSCQGGQSGTSGYTLSDSADISAGTNLSGNAGMKDPTRCVGGTSIVVYFEGIPDGVNQVLQVEVIYHVEGTPQVQVSSQAQLVTSSRPTNHTGSSRDVEVAMAGVSSVDQAVSFLQRGAQFLNDNSELLQTSYRSLRSLASAFGG